MGVVTNDSCGYIETHYGRLAQFWLLVGHFQFSPYLDTIGLPGINFHHFSLLVHTLERVDDPLQGPAVPVEVP